LQELHDYLLSFFRRTQPLSDLDSILEGFDQEFERKYNDGSLVKEWSNVNPQDPAASSAPDSSSEQMNVVESSNATAAAASSANRDDLYCQACMFSLGCLPRVPINLRATN
jgi:hypothetical protein